MRTSIVKEIYINNSSCLPVDKSKMHKLCKLLLPSTYENSDYRGAKVTIKGTLNTVSMATVNYLYNN